MNWYNELEKEKRLLVGELGRRIVAEKCSIGEEALEKTRRVSGRESMTFAWVSKT